MHCFNNWVSCNHGKKNMFLYGFYFKSVQRLLPKMFYDVFINGSGKFHTR